MVIDDGAVEKSLLLNGREILLASNVHIDGVEMVRSLRMGIGEHRPCLFQRTHFAFGMKNVRAKIEAQLTLIEPQIHATERTQIFHEKLLRLEQPWYKKR